MNSKQGRVLGSYPDLIQADGLRDAGLLDLVSIEGFGYAIVTALLTECVSLAPLTAPFSMASTISDARGARVECVGPLQIPTDLLEGRTLSCVGEPLDGGGGFENSDVQSIFTHPRSVLHPEGAFRRLTTGLLLYDLNHVFRDGSAILVNGPKAIADHIRRHRREAGSLCIDATSVHSPSLRREEHASVIRVEPGECAADAASWLVPWSAMRVGSSYCDRGYNVVVCLDNLESWLGKADRFPGRGDSVSQLGALTSMVRSRERGSLSFLAHHNGGISQRTKNVFDVQIDGDRCLQGRIDHRQSKLCRPAIQVDGMAQLGQCLVELAQLEERDKMPGFSARSFEGAAQRAMRLRAHLQFRQGLSHDPVESLIALMAVFGAENVEPTKVPLFVDRFLAEIRKEPHEILKSVRSSQLLSKTDQDHLDGLARSVAVALIEKS